MQEQLYAPCPRCQAKRISAEAKAQYPLTLIRPGSYGLKTRDRSTVRGIVCTNCGYIELYADNPNNLIPK